MIEVWLTSLREASLRGGIALLVAWALCQVPRVPAIVRCWVWRSAYAVLLISFIWTSPIKLPLLRAHPAMSGRDASQLDPTDPVPSQPFEPASHLIESHPNISAAPTITRPVAAPPHAWWLRAAFSAWIAFLFVYVIRLISSWFKSLRLRRGRPVEMPELAALCTQMNIRQRPKVLIDPAVRGPLMVGWWRPMIVLPDSLPGSNHRRLILAHELAHLRRSDLIWNWLPALALAALPMHPLVWICNRYWKLAAEAACDAEALAATSAGPAEYGRVLLAVACPQHASEAGVLAVMVAADSRWLLKRRLTAMSNRTRWNRSRLVAAALFVGAFTLPTALPWRVVAQQPPPDSKAPEHRNPAAQPSAIPRAGAPESRFNASALGQISVPEARIRGLTSGTVQQIGFGEGAAVKKGDVLVQLEAGARADAVTSAQQIAKTAHERCLVMQKQHEAGISTDTDVTLATLELDKAMDVQQQRQTELNETRITAPFDGILGDLKTSVGSSVLPGDPIATVFNTAHPMVVFSVPSNFARQLRPGVSIEVTSQNEAESLGKGQIIAGGPDVDPATGVINFKAQLTATNRPVAPHEFVNVRFHSGS